MTFKQFLQRKGYKVTSYIDPTLNKLVLSINGENILSKELPNHPLYSKLHRIYIMSQ